jgi:hypothetical protein
VQSSAVNAELWKPVPRCAAPGLSPDLLSETVHVDELVRSDGAPVQVLKEAMPGEDVRRWRENVDTHAELGQLTCLLVDLDGDSDPVERQGGGKSADAGPDDDDAHARQWCACTGTARLSCGFGGLDAGTIVITSERT